MSRNNKHHPMSNEEKSKVEQWVQYGLSTTEDNSGLIKFTEQQATFMGENLLTKTQFRNIFNELRRIETLFSEKGYNSILAIRALLKLKPKLAYISSRIDAKGGYRLGDILDEALTAIGNEYEQRFPNFMDLMEALMAYHYAKAKKD